MKFKPEKEIAVPALILCAICLIITGALSVTNFITKDTIEALNLQTEKKKPALLCCLMQPILKLEILKNLIM